MGCYSSVPVAPQTASSTHSAFTRPPDAVGTFLRMIMINDVYILDNYPKLAAAVVMARKLSESQNCVVTSHLNGDFLSPCIHTALDGGTTMMQALNYAKLDYACLGNHEFDMNKKQLQVRLPIFRGKLINSNGEDPELSSLPKFDVIKVGDKNVLFTGLCTQDTSIYSAKGCPVMRPFLESCTTAWHEASKKQALDIMVPMTHQLIAEDRALALDFQKDDVFQGKVPVILGGHEHEVFEECSGDSLILKVGQDAVNLGVIDVWWTESGEVKRRHCMVPAAAFDAEEKAAAWTKERKDFVVKAMEAAITDLPCEMSSLNVRYEPSNLASFLLQKFKRGLHQHEVEVVAMNGGGMRGKQCYKPGNFTLGDLYKELAFDEPFAVVTMTGSILAEAVKQSRAGTLERPGFLHLDDGCYVDADHQLTMVNQQPFVDEQEYKVCFPRSLLSGMNSIQPLIDFGKEKGIPDEESSVLAKPVIVEVCMKDLWRQLLGYSAWGMPHEDAIDSMGLKDGLFRAFADLDKDRSGLADSTEIETFLKTRMPEHASGSLAHELLKAVDKDGNGKVQIEELASFLH
mmetsp:Transcript_52204/g.124943  ORF Transcript_52204/g.124943 Transcript_52204/m.124943 type:complete len:572 (-) Transcript_52204:135-1850(-)